MMCIGLFGTCGGSSWRNKFIEKFSELGISYFNPQVADWRPELAEIEAEHLVNDEIILFPVTDETYGMGSLAETGFSIMQAIHSNTDRSVVIMVSRDVSEALRIADPVLAKESLRARALVRAHLKKMQKKNVYVVNSLEDMFAVSVKLYNVHKDLEDVRKLISESQNSEN